MTKRLTDQIAYAFEIALFLFFVNIIFAICLYFLTNNWVVARNPQQARVYQPPDNGTAWNPDLIYTNRGQFKLRCTDPYNEEEVRACVPP